jgi:Flp pilus assembly protein TadD
VQLCILLATILVLYQGSFNHGFVLDDNLVITSNKHVQDGFSGIGDLLKYNYAHGHAEFNDGLYRPLSLITFAIEKDLFGLNKTASHILQVLIYALLVLLLLLWLKDLFGENSHWPFFIALIFAAHPIHTEVVANLKSRDELLALLFFLASVIYFTKWISERQTTQLLIATGFMFIASFSKESAVTFVTIFPLVAWFKAPKFKTALTGSIIMMLPVIIFLIIRQWVLSELGPVDSGVSSLLQNSLIENDGFIERMATGALIQGLYFTKLFLPINLSHDYSYNAIEVSTLSNFTSIICLIVVGTLLALGVLATIKKRWIGFGILFYFITISAISNVFILIGAMAAERFTFAPSLGFAIAIVVASHQFIRQKLARNAILYSFIGLLVILTIQRVPDWKSNFTLFTADVNKVPNSARAQYDAGSAYIDEAKVDQRMASKYLNLARSHLKEAIRIWPDYQDAYNNLGISYMNDREYDQSYLVYSDFIKRFPSYTKARYNMAMSCYNLQRYDEAELHLEEFLATGIQNKDALYILAESEGFQQKFNEAIEHLNQLAAIEPNKDRSHSKLAMAYAITGNEQLAETELNKCLEINPNNSETHTNLALIYMNTGRIVEAKKSLETAIRLNSSNQRALNLLAQLGS